MNLLLKLAWRNIGRNIRRSILTVLAVVFATFLTVTFRGLAIGTWEFNVRNSVEMFSGYLQVQREGYQANPSLAKSLRYPGSIRSILLQEPNITAFAPRIVADGLVSFRNHSNGAMILGIEPSSENSVSRFQKRVVAGRFFSEGSPDEVVIGSTLLENLQAAVGDTLVILAQGFDGVLGNLLFRITGAIRMGVSEFDAATVLMDLSAAQELLAMDERVSIVAIGVKELDGLEEIRDRLAGGISREGLTGASVLTWEEVMPDLSQAMAFDETGDWIFLVILIIIVTFGILNTVLMSVTERFREFGVTLAVGMQTGRLVLLVILESLFLTLLGIAVGAALGQILNTYLAHNPIMFTGDYQAMYEQYGFLPQLVSSNAIRIVATVALVILGVSMLAILYPVYRVAKLEPLKGIRHT